MPAAQRPEDLAEALSVEEAAHGHDPRGQLDEARPRQPPTAYSEKTASASCVSS